MSDILIHDAGDTRRYFTQIPNIIDDFGLSPHAFRLYCHMKRVAGETGQCWQSTRTLAEACNMSVAMIVKSKKELDYNRLIIIETKKPKIGQSYHSITICDIWRDNILKYSPAAPDDIERSHCEQKCLDSEQKCSQCEPKNNPLRITLLGKENKEDIGKFQEFGDDAKFLENAERIFEPQVFRRKQNITDLIELKKDHGEVLVLDVLTWAADKDKSPGEAVSIVRKKAATWNAKPAPVDDIEARAAKMKASLQKYGVEA